MEGLKQDEKGKFTTADCKIIFGVWDILKRELSRCTLMQK